MLITVLRRKQNPKISLLLLFIEATSVQDLVSGGACKRDPAGLPDANCVFYPTQGQAFTCWEFRTSRRAILSIFLQAVLRIRDVYPGSWIPALDFYPSQIIDPTKATEEKENKCFFVLPFCNHKYNKAENYYIFEQVKKKTRTIILLFTPKIVTKLS